MSFLDRRQFIKTSAALGAGVALSPGWPLDVLAAPPAPVVARSRGTDPAAAVRSALDILGGIEKFVAPGDRVVIKPNIGWDRTPDLAATTHPEVVRQIALQCLHAGAARVQVFDRPCNDPRRCYTSSGIAPALAEIDDPRLEVPYVDRRKFEKLDIPGGKALTGWSFYRDVLEADKFINVPIAKHHSASVLTLAMKNVMGVIGKNRAVLHKHIHEYLPDLNRVVHSHLTVMDATRVLVANGPQGGRLEDVRRLDTVLAGTDIVAVDSVTCTLFDLHPEQVGYLANAHRQGLGVADLTRIRVEDAQV